MTEDHVPTADVVTLACGCLVDQNQTLMLCPTHASEQPAPPLTDSEKLRGLALWFDLYDVDREKARIILDDDVMPPKDEVQRDLRRIADQLEQPAPPLDVELLTTVLIEAEADDMLGSEYMPSRLAKYIAAHLGSAPSWSEPEEVNDD